MYGKALTILLTAPINGRHRIADRGPSSRFVRGSPPSRPSRRGGSRERAQRPPRTPRRYPSSASSGFLPLRAAPWHKQVYFVSSRTQMKRPYFPTQHSRRAFYFESRRITRSKKKKKRFSLKVRFFFLRRDTEFDVSRGIRRVTAHASPNVDSIEPDSLYLHIIQTTRYSLPI